MFCRTARRFSLDNIELAFLRISLLAICELSGKAAVIEGALTTNKLTGLPCRLPRSCSVDRFINDTLRNRGIFLEECSKRIVQDRLDNALYLGITEFCFCLSFELRVWNLYTDDGSKPFANVIPANAFLEILREVLTSRIGIHGSGKRRTKSGDMRASFLGIDIVGKSVQDLSVTVVPLKRDLCFNPILHATHIDRIGVNRCPILI